MPIEIPPGSQLCWASAASGASGPAIGYQLEIWGLDGSAEPLWVAGTEAPTVCWPMDTLRGRLGSEPWHARVQAGNASERSAWSPWSDVYAFPAVPVPEVPVVPGLVLLLTALGVLGRLRSRV